jgi:hypothetical protein
MTAHQGFRVAATMTGTASSPFEEYRINYVYGGDDHDGKPPPSSSMAESSADRKRRKRARLAELDAHDPPLSLSEIARRMQLAPKTIRGYRAELVRNRKAGS